MILRPLLYCTFFTITGFAISQSTYEKEVLLWQDKLNAEYANPDESPLSSKEIKKFKGLEFFPINPKFRIEAKFQRTPNETPFTMPTTTDRLPVYIKYGVATFTVDGTEFILPVYQNLQLREKDEYEDYLFAPFTDETSGFDSYGGGRYIDLRTPEVENVIILDFNKAYNPYCAYNAKYSCPIPPRENDLALEVKAGVKAWDK